MGLDWKFELSGMSEFQIKKRKIKNLCIKNIEIESELNDYGISEKSKGEY